LGCSSIPKQGLTRQWRGILIMYIHDKIKEEVKKEWINKGNKE